jgi:hypothetical protein
VTAVAIALLIATLVWFALRRSRSGSVDTDSTADSAPELRITFEAFRVPAEDDEERDAWEGGFWEATDPRDLETRLQIAYTDGSGSPSTRVVRVRSFDNALYGGIFIGHCELRNATRTFRFDRVREAVDVATGEVIADVRTHLNRLYQSSGRQARDTLRQDHLDLVRVLLYVARADGQFRAAEKDIARRYLRDLAGDPRVTDSMIDGLFEEVGTQSLAGFKRAFGRIISEQIVDPAKLEQACREMVATQETASAGEQEALVYLERRLARAASERARS